MAIIDNLLVQIWIGSLVAMVILGVIISVWAAWRTISRQRSQLLAVNTELDLRVNGLKRNWLSRPRLWPEPTRCNAHGSVSSAPRSHCGKRLPSNYMVRYRTVSFSLCCG